MRKAELFFPRIPYGYVRSVFMDQRERLLHRLLVFREHIAYLAAAGSEHQPEIGRGAAPSTGPEVDLLYADENTL